MINITTTSSLQYYQKVLSIISALSPLDKQLSSLEIDTLSRFLDLPPKFEHFPFTALARKEIYKQYTPNLTVSQLSARVSAMVAKGYVVRDEDNLLDFSPHIKKLRKTTFLDVKIQNNTSNRKDS